MYTVTVYASWARHAAGEVRGHGTFQLRGAAMEAADSCAYPIVDVRDIGEAGCCPARPTLPDGPQGHRFVPTTLADGQHDWTGPWGCRDCGADQDDLYIAGTAIPREPDNEIVWTIYGESLS